MTIFVVAYDEHEGQDYRPLIEAIKAFGTWWHCLNSTWLVKTDLSAAALRDHLWGKMYSNDKLLIVRYHHSTLGGDAAWSGFARGDAKCNDWLNEFL